MEETKLVLKFRGRARLAYLLNMIIKEDMQIIFNKIHNMYEIRSKILHGAKEVDLTYNELWDFRKYVRFAIFLIIFMNVDKNKIIELLDNTFLNDLNSKKDIVTKISQAKERLIEFIV